MQDKERWDILLEKLSKIVTKIGFNSSVLIDQESGIVSWEQESNDIVLLLSLIPAQPNSKDICFWIQIGIESKEIKNIIDSLKLWNCDPNSFSSIDRAYKRERIANVNFFQLLRSFSHPLAKATYAFNIDKIEDELEKLEESIDFAQTKLLYKFLDAQFIAKELYILGESKKSKLVYGLSSSDPYIFSALLYRTHGFPSEAIEMLERGLVRDIKENSVSWEGNVLKEVNEITQCRYGKVINYLRKQLLRY
ncbi:hypothetical protein EYS14_17910 [Alteromonadaceae bacterium M269]|nr:hypothetical protein EYS14_17910 [Alteromonadaceae bacterium M269]